MSLPLFFVDQPDAAGQLDTAGTARVAGTAGASDALGALRSASAGDAVGIALAPDEFKHMRALRLREGEHFVVSDGCGAAFELQLACDISKNPNDHSRTGHDRGRVQKASDHAGAGGNARVVTARLVGPAPLPRRANVTLVQGVSKGERMEILVRQAVELGVARIVPALTARCVVRLDAAKRAARAGRWRAIALAAAKQSGQPLVPRIAQPLDFGDAVALAAREADVIVCPWEECQSGASFASELRGAAPDASVFVFVGPEGGFEPAEVEALRRVGAKVVTLGDTILRTETAGVIASALAIYELGGLGNGGSQDASAPIAGFADGVAGSDPRVRPQHPTR